MPGMLSGTVKSARAIDVTKKTGGKSILLAFDVADEVGTIYACQMWDDDPQQSDLLSVVEQMRRQPVQLVFAGYTTRLRTMADGKERPQTNFIATNVVLPNLGVSSQQ